MAHYAFLNSNNIVQQVIVGRDEDELDTDWEQYYSQVTGMSCKRTSYNTRRGVYYNPETNQPDQNQSKAFRKNYAGVGFIYDAQLDAFIPPKPKFNLLQYQIDAEYGCWIVLNLDPTKIIPFADGNFVYTVNDQHSVLLAQHNNGNYEMLSLIDTEFVISYVNQSVK